MDKKHTFEYRVVERGILGKAQNVLNYYRGNNTLALVPVSKRKINNNIALHLK